MQQQRTIPRAGVGWRVRPKREQALVFLYLALACLTLAHAIYLGYGDYFADITSKHGVLSQQEYYKLHNTIALTADHPFFHGDGYAPNQYRIGVEWLAKLIGDRVGVAKYYIVFSVIDFFCALGAGLLGYGALAASEFFAGLGEPRQRLAVAALMAALAYPFAWVVPWQRPETLPSALYVTGTLAMLPRIRARRWWLAVLAAATVWQSLVRADVPVVLGVAVVMLGPTSEAKAMFGSRARCMGTGALVAGIAFALQEYLKRAIFPHASYPPDTTVLQLAANLGARHLIAFAIAVLPWALVMVLAVRFHRLLDGTDKVAGIASGLYLPLWCAVGIVSEVRLFVPFLLGLTPLMAKLVVIWLREDDAVGFPLTRQGKPGLSILRSKNSIPDSFGRLLRHEDVNLALDGGDRDGRQLG